MRDFQSEFAGGDRWGFAQCTTYIAESALLRYDADSKVLGI